MSRTRHHAVLSTLAAGLLTAGLAPGTAQAAKTSFSGSCQLAGAAAFSPGVTANTRQQSGRLDASGTCSGDGGGFGRLVADVRGPVSCAGSTKPSTGQGTLTVGGREIPVTVIFDVKLPVGSLSLGGMNSGAARGGVNFANPSNIFSMGRCVGAGIKSARFVAKFTTSSTLVSGSDDPVAQQKPRKKKHRKHKKRS